MAQSERVTLEDIAERLDLTKVSISKALRGHPDISSETKERVEQTAREMGYAPNRWARSLSTDKTGTLGVIVPKISHNFFAGAIAGINDVASAHEYEIVLCVSEENATFERRHLRTLLSMQVEGLLVSVSEETKDPEVFTALQDQGVPLVFFDRVLKGIGASTVTVDDYEGAYQAVKHAIENDHRDIAHVGGFSHINIGQERRAGYEKALREYGIPVRDDWIVEGGFDESHGYQGFKALFEAGARPDAVFAVTFPVALGVADAMQQVDPSLQEDVQIYSFGQHGLNRFFQYSHISVYQPARNLGKKASAVLLDEIEDPNQDPRHVELDTDVIVPTSGMKPPYLDGG
jgi:LacI family transcriptional regulator